MDLADVEKAFTLTHGGVFMERSGRGRRPGTSYSQKKLCFVATDKALLAELLLELSARPDCYYVKYRIQPRDGMYLGRCFMLDDEVVGELWRA